MSARATNSPEPIVRLSRVVKHFREGAGLRAVFDGVDLEVERGEFAVVFGRSGSGKSTLLNLISGIDLADAGSVQVLGHDLGRIGEERRTLLRRAHMGFIFQFYNLVPTLSVGENLMFPLELNGLGDAAGERHARDLLARVGLADRWAAFPDRLSGGEQQRVAVARALVHDPALVLADEPTGNLDDESAASVIALITQLLRPERKTLILVTHNPAFAELADRTLRVAHGAIEAQVQAR